VGQAQIDGAELRDMRPDRAALRLAAVVRVNHGLANVTVGQRRDSAKEVEPRAYVDLYWIPLGAGAHVVRLSGKVFEAIAAWIERRPRYDLYHSALIAQLPEGRFVIEQTPVIDGLGRERGVAVEGPVGMSLIGRFRLFRYEVRRWRDGVIPDLADAVGEPVRITDDSAVALRIVDLVASVPPLVWGRDERRTGEMWNSNAIVSWLLTSAGVDAGAIEPPPGGRAPGWRAGIVVAEMSVK
jgi:hypothetical protein